MAFWDNLFSRLKGTFGQTGQTEQTASEGQSERRGGFFGAVFGTGNDDPRDDQISITEANIAEEELDRFAPEDRSQGLFYLGWLDFNVSSDVRGAARRRWEQEYGEWNPRKGRKTLSPEGWAQWRAWLEKNGTP